LYVAADRYGLDRLRVMCERRLAFAVDASTVAATLALAEQHGCSRLKAKCVEFIAGGSRENLHAVLKTDGFKDLEVNHPAD
jgi:speckle-type POZ protein